MEKTKKKCVVQNASIYVDIKIENFFWLSSIIKNRQIASLVIEIDNIKMANLLIEKRLVFDHSFYEYIKYNPTCKVKQYYKCYKYDHI